MGMTHGDKCFYSLRYDDTHLQVLSELRCRSNQPNQQVNSPIPPHRPPPILPSDLNILITFIRGPVLLDYWLLIIGNWIRLLTSEAIRWLLKQFAKFATRLVSLAALVGFISVHDFGRPGALPGRRRDTAEQRDQERDADVPPRLGEVGASGLLLRFLLAVPAVPERRGDVRHRLRHPPLRCDAQLR